MKLTRTWVLIADGARARILQNDGTNHELRAIEGFEFKVDHSATHDIVSDREGRSFSSQGHGRSAIDARSDPHRELKTQFAHRLADVLAKGLEQKSYEQLILVASPVTLGDLRAAISKQVHAVVIGEVAKDLTKIPNGEVVAHLKDVFASL